MEIIIFIFGLIFGSFANVCIFRLPKSKSLVTPGSYCPSCKKSLKWQDNIPLLGYIFLKGKCRFCKKKIPLRYPLVELICGIGFLMIYMKFGLTAPLFFYAIFFLSMVIISFIDIDTYLISDVIVLPGIPLGLAASAFFPGMHYGLSRMDSLLYSLYGMLAGGLILLALGFFGKIVFKKDAMGGGDVKMLAMIGAFLGWKSVFLTLFFASLVGTVISLALIGMKKKTMEDYVPFGPYLALASIIALFIKGTEFLGFFIN